MNTKKETKEKEKIIKKNFVLFTKYMKEETRNDVIISLSKYDVYFDSILEEVGPNGLSSKIIFVVTKEGKPIDCKVKIMSLNEKVVLFEELVKKKEIPIEISKKERIITCSAYQKLLLNTKSKDVEVIFQKTKDEKKTMIVADCIEETLLFMTNQTSSFQLKKGIFVISFEVDEGNGKIFQFKTLVKRIIDSSSVAFNNSLKIIHFL